ncbi:hypothetical protein EW146_g324 [Bondarzewia mesenterica]|uniref:Uncharacterized protein n=1 Tax=Bondarzewia mesenterica TaxID=1095465 RepID=A0A4S4M7P7_9AGAM|nr:hypothetical protein EW146_g324 [Bondarzewia mesenterica]
MSNSNSCDGDSVLVESASPSNELGQPNLLLNSPRPVSELPDLETDINRLETSAPLNESFLHVSVTDSSTPLLVYPAPLPESPAVLKTTASDGSLTDIDDVDDMSDVEDGQTMLTANTHPSSLSTPIKTAPSLNGLEMDRRDDTTGGSPQQYDSGEFSETVTALSEDAHSDFPMVSPLEMAIDLTNLASDGATTTAPPDLDNHIRAPSATPLEALHNVEMNIEDPVPLKEQETTAPTTNVPAAITAPRDRDLLNQIPNMYRLLDLVLERGSGGLGMST